MKFTILIFFTLLSFLSKCQSIDSTWLAENVLSKYRTDTTTFLQSYTFTNDNGITKLLSDYKGKILYVDVWSSNCGPCIGLFPYQEQLLKRLKIFHLDTSVIFININIKDTRSNWKKALQKYHPIGINLHSSDSSLYDKWNIEALPCHILISRSGYLFGVNIAGPDDGMIDWILYSSTKGIKPIEAIWRSFSQEKLMEKYWSPSAITDKEYAKWFKDFMPALLEYAKWRAIHEGSKNP